MPQITNIHNLPKTLLNMLARDPYSRGKADFSVTQLIGPPRISLLREKYMGEMEEDVSDRLWSLMGRAVHTVCEQGAGEEHIVEERLYGNVGRSVVSGAIDVQEVAKTPQDAAKGEILIDDYKTVSVWSATSSKPEWEAQLNIYRWLVEHNKPEYDVTRLRIVAILRDWSRSEAKRNPEYPPAPVMMIEIPLWTKEHVERFVNFRVALHNIARNAGSLPECTPAERWSRPDSWAVQKVGGKRAWKVFDNEAGADELLGGIGPKKRGDYEKVHRRGDDIRCSGNYCGVNTWCEQWKAKQGQTPAPVAVGK